MLNIRPTTSNVFVTVCLFMQPKACRYAHVAWSWHKRTQGKRILNRRKNPQVTTLARPPSAMSKLRIVTCDGLNQGVVARILIKSKFLLDIANSCFRRKSTVFYKAFELKNSKGVCTTMRITTILLNIAGIPRMSSVTIFQSDHFVLSTNFLFKFNVSLPLVTGELLQNTVDVNNVTYKL